MNFKSITLNKERKVVLDCYILDDDIIYKVKYRPAVIVMPGGGYSHLSHFEGEPVAMEYLNAGYNAFVLKYSVGEYYSKGMPLKDYEMAYEYIKENSEELRVMMDKIAVCGFSAGGHLASEVCVASKYIPNAAILIYPVTSQESLDRNNMDALNTIDRLSSIRQRTSARPHSSLRRRSLRGSTVSGSLRTNCPSTRCRSFSLQTSRASRSR